MPGHSSWSISLGRWGGLNVRLHMLFLVFAACTLYLSRSLIEAGSSEFAGIAAGSLGILLLSVLLHELGHCVAAFRCGCEVDEIVIGPLGGFTSMTTPASPRAECLIHLAGPFVNLLICSLCSIPLLVKEPAGLLGLLHPLAPENLVEGTLTLQVFKLCFWINWLLLLVNLLPAFPFDGGRALRAGLSAFRPDVAPSHAAFIVANLAKVAAVGLLALAWILRHDTSNPSLPLWFSLMLLAILLYFSAKQEEDRSQEPDMENELFGYDFSKGFAGLDQASAEAKESSGPVRRWIERRRRMRAQRQRQLEADEEQRVDDILARLHDQGINMLSEDDRSLLSRVSARYRQRNSEQR